jgi:hypothetical protein
VLKLLEEGLSLSIYASIGTTVSSFPTSATIKPKVLIKSLEIPKNEPPVLFTLDIALIAF